jgi:peptidyl-tRNA hydrolase
VVQSAHSIADFAAEFPQIFSQWKMESNSIICLSVKDEQELLKLYDKLRTQGVSVVKFFEPDIDADTSICLYGTPEVRKKLSSLPLSLRTKESVLTN